MTFFGKSKGKHSRGKRQQDKPLNDVPQSLDYHISDKDKLIYYSEGKMKSCEDMYGVKTTKKKFSATVSATTSAEGLSAGLSPSFEDSPKGKRKILSDIGKELQDRKELYFEPDLVREKFALIRVIAKCGTMWPWAGNDEEFQRVVWWVGKTAGSLTILAYGSMENYLEDPAPKNDAGKATWWPSRAEEYFNLIKAMTANAISPEWEDFSEEVKSKSIDGLYRCCFNDGVEERAPFLHKQKVLEMLLRIDNIEKSSNDCNKNGMICGSPLWVKEVNEAVPGTYDTGQCGTVSFQWPGHKETVECHVVADWTGDYWGNPRWIPATSGNQSQIPKERPELPQPSNVPDLQGIRSLAL